MPGSGTHTLERKGSCTQRLWVLAAEAPWKVPPPHAGLSVASGRHAAAAVLWIFVPSLVSGPEEAHGWLDGRMAGQTNEWTSESPATEVSYLTRVGGLWGRGAWRPFPTNGKTRVTGDT